MKYWLFLLLGVGLEICGTVCLRLSEGFARLAPSVALFVFYALAFVFVTLAVKGIALSTAYAVWSGLGTALIALIGIAFFQEIMTWGKAVSLTLVLVGIVGLKLSSGQ